MTIVEADGIYTEPTLVTDLYIATAQRYSVLVKMKPTADKNYAILASMDSSMYDSVPDFLQTNVTGVLVYDKTKAIPVEAPPVASFNPIDEFTLVPLDRAPAISDDPDINISLDLDFGIVDGLNKYVDLIPRTSTRMPYNINSNTFQSHVQRYNIYCAQSPDLVHSPQRRQRCEQSPCIWYPHESVCRSHGPGYRDCHRQPGLWQPSNSLYVL